MKTSANHLETMESRTLLSSAAPYTFVFAVQSLGQADALPLAPYGHHTGADIGSWSEKVWAERDANFDPHTFIHVQQLGQVVTGIVWIGEFYENGGWMGGFVGKVELPIPDVDVPPQYMPHPQGSGDSEGRSITGKPAHVTNRPSETTPQTAAESAAARDTSSVTAVSTVVLHDSADSSANTFAHAASAMSSPFARMATISVQGALQSGRSNMIYLSFLDQTGPNEPIMATLAARLRAAVISLPAVALRETGVAVFANGGNVLSVAPKNFEFAHFASPLMLVADSVGSFIQASTMIPFANSPVATSRRAWMVTATVVAADAILLGYYYQKRRKAQAALAMETALAR